MNFLLGILQSLVANAIFSLYGTRRKTRSKDAFEKRAKQFHKDISPHLLNDIIPTIAPELKKFFYELPYGRELILLPFIDISPKDGIVMPSYLQTSKKRINENSEFLSWLQNDLKKKLCNNATYTVDGISSNSELSIGIGDYFSTLCTSDIHYFNLIRYFPLKYKPGVYFSYRHGKYVNAWLKSLRSIVLDNNYSHYCASIGCSVLTVVKSLDGKYKYLIKNNSIDKGSSAFERHVIPSFMFQPISRRIHEQERELDLKLSVIREYGEELLGLEEFESAESVDVLLGHIQRNKLLSKLRDNIEKGEAILVRTGFVLDAYRLRPEITFLLIIHDDEYSTNIMTNWETEPYSLDYIELEDDESYFELVSASEAPLCGPGLAALINGRGLAVDLLKEATA